MSRSVFISARTTVRYLSVSQHRSRACTWHDGNVLDKHAYRRENAGFLMDVLWQQRK